MILEFSIENYRSFKTECTLSLVAESSKSKSDNVFEHQMANGDSVRLLKSAVLYGANASGKSNLLKALQALRNMAGHLGRAGLPIRVYEPFLFDTASQNAPTRFILSFVGPSNFKYIYSLLFNGIEIIEESLDYFPKSQRKNLFIRPTAKSADGLIHTVKMGQDTSLKTLKVLKNQTVISKFGTDSPDEFFTPIYLYFKDELTIMRNLISNRRTVEEKIYESPRLQKRLSKLIKIADTKIEEIIIKKNEENGENEGISDIFEIAKRRLYQRTPPYDSLGKHVMYKSYERVGEVELPFDQESKGTNVLFVLGAEILDKLEKGGVFLVDEIDTSLHPKLAKFLVMLFQHPTSNPHNAQLIFTTHETTFLDKNVFRKDQIWFTEKNDYGESELFSVQDFDGVREDTPFEKWYLSGKFGGIPNIREIEFIFQHEPA